MSQKDSTPSEVTLIDLPTELILYIFDFVPVRILHHCVRRVCKRFFDLLEESYYKNRFKAKYVNGRGENPFLRAFGLLDCKEEPDLSWEEVSVRNDIRENLFGDLFDVEIKGSSHSTGVDTVRLLEDGKFCVTGGRDKLMCLWKMGDMSKPVAKKSNAHAGWVWDFASRQENRSVFSCGWETIVKEWTYERGSLENVRTYWTERAAMRLASRENLLFAGLHTGKVVIFDPREGENAATTYKCHRGAVTGLKLWKDTVLTVGEDRRLVVYDLRSGKKYCRESVALSCPRCVAVDSAGLVYVGDTQGTLSVLQLTSGKPKEIARTTLLKSVNALLPSLEGLIVGTSSGELNFLSLARPFELQFSMALKGEVTCLDFWKDTIVVGTSDSEACFRVMQRRSEIVYEANCTF